MRRLFKWALVGFVFFVVAVILFYLVENWRGARAWTKAQEELKAAGISTRFEDYIPREVPDEENFCRTPVMLKVLEGALPQVPLGSARKMLEQSTVMVQLEDVEKTEPPVTGRYSGTGVNLSKWREYYTNGNEALGDETDADFILQKLNKYEPDFAELGEAAITRRYSQFVMPYTTRPMLKMLDEMKHHRVERTLSTRLMLHAVAFLEAGETEKTLRNFDILFRIQEAYAKDPMLLSQLIRMRYVSLNAYVVWEGALRRRWDGEQLKALQMRLESIRLLDDFRKAAVAESGSFQVQSIEDLGNLWWWDRVVLFEQASGSRLASVLVSLVPQGWYDRNKVATGYSSMELSRLVGHEGWKEYAEKHKMMAELTPYNFAGEMVKPLIASVYGNISASENLLKLAETACALERYYIDKGEYPEMLGALVPEYMNSVPLDVMDGKSLRYARTEDGRYKIYSVGLNGVDDGGVRGLVNGKFDMKRAKDWVWSYVSEGVPTEKKPKTKRKKQ